ncbi:hypothetical protein [Enterococcus xiangfangensis]|uniref:hypothetical protein n=1 Tax=Enterococcus xiangfangensis TaxID=1296537 RepID=UPI0010F95936|nr:hypothetical protein [Enterococcus xiangfangensis]MBM7711029.1 ABC-type Fe3+ transport system permease subunit [Enterococcus xiangfangensis]NBK07794.1 hypothetical protein [Enterococcus asini]
MPFLVLLIDLFAALIYFFQLNTQSHSANFVGLIIQTLITLILLVITFKYKGKRYANIQPVFFMKYLSIRYAIIVISTLINLVVLFLYFLNFLGINNVIFAGF